MSPPNAFTDVSSATEVNPAALLAEGVVLSVMVPLMVVVVVVVVVVTTLTTGVGVLMSTIGAGSLRSSSCVASR